MRCEGQLGDTALCLLCMGAGGRSRWKQVRLPGEAAALFFKPCSRACHNIDPRASTVHPAPKQEAVEPEGSVCEGHRRGAGL